MYSWFTKSKVICIVCGQAKVICIRRGVIAASLWASLGYIYSLSLWASLGYMYIYKYIYIYTYIYI